MATMIIEGERTKAASGETYEVRNPATGEVVDEVPAGGPADVDRAAQAAAKAFPAWSKLAPNKRAEILHKAARHMLGKVEEIAPLLTREQGKTLRHYWTTPRDGRASLRNAQDADGGDAFSDEAPAESR